MLLICPECRTNMHLTSAGKHGEVWRCEECGLEYPVSDGAVRCMPENDDFYEGKFPGRYVLWRPRTAPGRLPIRVTGARVLSTNRPRHLSEYSLIRLLE